MTSVSPPVAAPHGPSGPTASRTGRRRARSLPGALAVTLLSMVLPGAGHAWSGRRWGYGILAVAVAGAAGCWYALRDVDRVVDLAFDPDRLRIAAALAAAALVLWVAVVVSSYVVVRPRPMPAWKHLLGAAGVALLCLTLVAPLGFAARYATVQADLVTDLFEDNETATAPRGATVADPWKGQDRVNVLLLGGDGSVTRDGVRTDTVIVMSLDTHTGDSVMFSLPRNMEGAQFPADSPLHDLYPYGFTGAGDVGTSMLNAVYGQIPVLHPGVLGGSTNEGADAVKQAVSGSLGLPIHYYVLVNLDGFKQIVDAMGGVTVNINEPVAIHGDTDRGIPPVDYLDPGPDQRLNGFQALWFARGRYGSDDYERMLRQRCMIQAIIDEAKPLNLLRRYQALAEAGKEIIRTDIPADLLPAFVDLGLLVKDARVRSVAFVPSDRFFPGDPDFAWLQSAVDRALQPPERRTPGAPAPEPSPTLAPDTEADPGAAVEVADSCEYQPVG